MTETIAKKSLIDYFSALEDPRQAWKVEYPLPEIMLLVLCATLAGAETFVETAQGGRTKLDFLRQLLPFKRGIPSHDALTTTARRFFISSLALDQVFFAKAVRAHWGVENRLHWVLDVVFHDDLMRLRTENGPKNMATVKHMALNLIKSAPGKASLRVKRKTAGWDDAFLLATIHSQSQ